MEANISDQFPTQPKYAITHAHKASYAKQMLNIPREVNIALMLKKAEGVVLFGNGSSEKCGRGVAQNST